MAQSLLKLLLCYFTFTASVVVLAAPGHQHQTEPHARVIDRREDIQLLSRPQAAAPIAISHGGRRRATNAMRFAKGLPPLAPRKLYTGSQAGSAHRARSSPVPLWWPNILVYAPGIAQPLGYVSTDPTSDWGAYYLNRDCAQINEQLLVNTLTNPTQPDEYSSIGFAVPPGSDTTFGPESSSFAFMSGTAATPNGSPPVISTKHSMYPGTELYIESSIWSLGPDNELIPTWINPNGDEVQMEIGYIPSSDDSIIITGSLTAFNAESNIGEAIPIHLYAGGRGCSK